MHFNEVLVLKQISFKNPRNAQGLDKIEGLLGGFLVPFQNCPMFPCSRTFSVFVPLVMNLLTMVSSFNL